MEAKDPCMLLTEVSIEYTAVKEDVLGTVNVNVPEPGSMSMLE